MHTNTAPLDTLLQRLKYAVHLCTQDHGRPNDRIGIRFAKPVRECNHLVVSLHSFMNDQTQPLTTYMHIDCSSYSLAEIEEEIQHFAWHTLCKDVLRVESAPNHHPAASERLALQAFLGHQMTTTPVQFVPRDTYSNNNTEVCRQGRHGWVGWMLQKKFDGARSLLEHLDFRGAAFDRPAFAPWTHPLTGTMLTSLLLPGTYSLPKQCYPSR